MAIFALPNPKTEISVKFPINNVKSSINEVITSFIDYTLIQEDNVTNRIKILVKEADMISNLSLDMGQHLDIILNDTTETATKIHLEVSRVVGVIDQQFEANRAKRTLDTFLTLLSKSLEGKLPEVIEQNLEAQREQEDKASRMNNIGRGILISIILFMIIIIYLIRKKNGS
jgi:hypothetical protein